MKRKFDARAGAINGYGIALAVCVMVAVGLLTLTFRSAWQPGDTPAQAAKSGNGNRQLPGATSGPQQPTRFPENAPPEQTRDNPLQPSREPPSRAPDQGPIASEAVSAREQAVVAWEKLVDTLAESQDVPDAPRMAKVKEAFARLSGDDQRDAIHRALNLLPDEQFPALYAILFDKNQDPEILDAIFNDALNRPEDLKNPLLKELSRDREHPSFFESARILDAMGPLE